MPPWKKNHKSKLKGVDALQRESSVDEPPQMFMSRQPSLVNNNDMHRMMDAHELRKIVNNPPLTTSIAIEKRKVDIKIECGPRQGDVYFLKDQEVHVNEQRELLLGELIAQIKLNSKVQFDSCLISILNRQETISMGSQMKVYNFCGQDPLPESFKVSIDLASPLEIKLRSTKQSLIDQLLEEQHINQNMDPQDESLQSNFPRVKERKIHEVIEKVALWRRFYTGFYDENHKFVQMPLDQAASRVRISKKTLDDYLLQIRCGKRYGFDFNKHKDERIGKLRSHVKDKRKVKPV